MDVWPINLQEILSGVMTKVNASTQNLSSVLIETTLVVDPQIKREGLSSAEGDKRKLIKVAVGVVLNSEDAFLLASRPEGKAYAGYWEFPGGKYEEGETGKEALARELQEELGVNIDLNQTSEWRVQMVDYPHALVELNFFLVRGFKGELQTLEGQTLTWSQLPVTVSPVLPGALPVLDWLAVDRAFIGPTHF